MNGNDIRKLMLYLYNVQIDDFAKEVYDKDFTDFYVEEKYDLMLKSFYRWIGELDKAHLQRLADVVNKKGES